ncbi:hypothetical protein DPMN_136976 [Dreissena polymorpha]|uniref:Uncharacterized protein n=1 Tax=Dreissena polymorpha TaxID=45954 RepID=A0A9D4G3V5_DREPO|nr:hypothetical protein DPMN_136976 [Dreissena polymorpha]
MHVMVYASLTANANGPEPSMPLPVSMNPNISSTYETHRQTHMSLSQGKLG